jgi:phthiodiolone/phenolphthiodiolone dimycocerosates ketoreductase
MSKQGGRLETAYMMWGDRYGGASAVRAQAEALQASGVVDRIICTEQYGNLIHGSLWTPENTPMAALMPDCDSMMDAVATACYALGAAPDMGVVLCSDANRRGPIELATVAMTLAELSGGRAQVWLGAGEIKNMRPLGYPRQGLAKLEDILKVTHRIWEDPSPLDFDGRHWKLRSAIVGGQRNHRPQIWGLGEGPRLLDLATSYADGLASVVPLKFPSPKACSERIEHVRALLLDKGRDPDDFKIGMDVMMLAHPDVNVIERALDNPLVKWMTAMAGRVGTANWEKAGLTSPVPDDWAYYRDYVPEMTSPQFIEEAISKVTRAHVEASWIIGTPAQVAAQVREYAATGLSLIGLINYLPMILDPDQAAQAFAGDIEICGQLKPTASRTPFEPSAVGSSQQTPGGHALAHREELPRPNTTRRPDPSTTTSAVRSRHT